MVRTPDPLLEKVFDLADGGLDLEVASDSSSGRVRVRRREESRAHSRYLADIGGNEPRHPCEHACSPPRRRVG